MHYKLYLVGHMIFLINHMIIIFVSLGLTGVHPFNGSVVRVNEGAEMAKLSWIIYPSSSLDAVQLFRGEVMSNLAVFDDSSECMQPMTSEFPTVLSVSVSSPNESSQGEYTLIVSGLSSGQNTSNISLRSKYVCDSNVIN